MKIAMPKNEKIINQHFGKSKSFAIVTVEDNKIIDIKDISTEVYNIIMVVYPVC